MISEEERQGIIREVKGLIEQAKNEVKEEAILALPEIIGSLIMNHANLIALNREFYRKYPDFAKNKDIVTAVVEVMDGNNPGMDYKKILEKAVPVIKEQIKTARGLDKTVVSRPNRRLPSLSDQSDHGEL